MKVAIIGVGHVGATLAYSLLGVETVSHVQLVGRNQQRLEGEALDLRHAASIVAAPPKISFGTVGDCADADILVLTLSVPQHQPDRNACAVQNADLFAEVVPQLARRNPQGIFLVATNPVEALTQIAIECSGFPVERVIGTGTVIDSCRFRAALSSHLGVHPDDLRAYVLGEHGDSQFVWYSGAAMGGVLLEPAEIPQHVVDSTKSAGVDILRLKGHTSYAIAQALCLIIRSIAGDQCRTMPVSTQVDMGDDFGEICLAAPCVVGRGGIVRRLSPRFNAGEQEQWLASAQSVSETLSRIREAMSSAS